MAAPVVNIDISTALSAKADGDTVSNTDLGVIALDNAYAYDEGGGTIALRSELATDTGTPGGMSIGLESVTVANARSNAYYMLRFQLTPLKTGTTSNSYGNIWWRPQSSSSAVPWIALHADDRGVSFGVNKRTNGVNTLDFGASSTSGTSIMMKYGETYDVVLALKKSGTAALRAMGMWIDGVPVAICHEISAAITMSGSYGAGVTFPYLSTVTWVLNGNLRIYDQNDIADAIEQSGSSRLSLPLPNVSGLASYGFTRTNHTSETETYVHKTILSGVQSGDSWLSLSGTSASGSGGVTTSTFVPVDAIDFGTDGYLHTTLDQVSGITDGIHEIRIEDGSSNSVVAVRIDDTGASTDLDYRIEDGAWTQLATGLVATNAYRIRFTQRSNGTYHVLIKDDSDAITSTGGLWSFSGSTSSTTARTTVISRRTRTAIGATVALIGGVRWQQRACIWLYCDSWTDGAIGSGPEVHLANHIMRESYGAFVAQRNGKGGDSFAIGNNTFVLEGNGGFGHSGTSIEEWLANTSNIYEDVKGHDVVLGISIMNSLSENDTDINTGGATEQAVKDAIVADYREVVQGLGRDSNAICFVLPTPPPSGGVNWPGPAASNQDVFDFTSEIIGDLTSMLESVTIQPGSSLAIADPYQVMVDASDYSGLAWDGLDTHLNDRTSEQTVYDAIFSSPISGGIFPKSLSSPHRRMLRMRNIRVG